MERTFCWITLTPSDELKLKFNTFGKLHRVAEFKDLTFSKMGSCDGYFMSKKMAINDVCPNEEYSELP